MTFKKGRGPAPPVVILKACSTISKVLVATGVEFYRRMMG